MLGRVLNVIPLQTAPLMLDLELKNEMVVVRSVTKGGAASDNGMHTYSFPGGILCELLCSCVILTQFQLQRIENLLVEVNFS